MHFIPSLRSCLMKKLSPSIHAFTTNLSNVEILRSIQKTSYFGAKEGCSRGNEYIRKEWHLGVDEFAHKEEHSGLQVGIHYKVQFTGHN